MEPTARRGGRFQRVLLGIGEFQAGLLLSLTYLVLWLPVGLVTSLGPDWLRRRAPIRTNWWTRDRRVNNPAHLREPF